MRDAARELSQGFDLLHLVQLCQGGFALPGSFFDSSLQLPIGLFQFCGPFLDAALKLGIELFELAALSVQLGEYPDLSAQ